MDDGPGNAMPRSDGRSSRAPGRPPVPTGSASSPTFPTDFAGDVVNFTWKIEDGSLILKVVNPPDHILPIIMESHPWQPAG